MPRYTRNTFLLAKAEVTYGLDPTPTGAANAMLVSKPNLTPLSANNVPRDVLLGFLGNAEHLVGARFMECSFDIEAVGSGVAGTAPAFSPLMLACAMAETNTAVVRTDYTPVSSSFGSASFYWHDDGVLHKMQGARGTVTFKYGVGGIPVLSFNFKGLYSTPTAVANPTPTLTGFKTPAVVSEANTADLTFGATHTLAILPALTAGTTYPSQGIEVMLNNTVEHVALLGGETIEITQRDPSCNFAVELTAAQEVTFMTAIEAATLTSVGLIHGTVAGYKSLLWLPSVQRISPTLQDVSGKRLIGVDGRVLPTSAGNDEVRISFF